MFGLLKNYRRNRYRKKGLSDDQLKHIYSVAPIAWQVPEHLRQKYHETILIFLHEKNFEGCGGLTLNDSIRYSVAAHASLLLLGDVSDFYPDLYSILIYPTAYIAPVHDMQEDGVIVEGREMRYGESWGRGSLVLAWDEASADAARPTSGRNLVIHEFSHEIDQEFALTEEPTLLEFESWGKTLSHAYDRHVYLTDHHRPTLLDAYGATNMAEFFAVTTEMFFGKPGKLIEVHPRLYEEISKVYNLDPANW